MRVTEDNVKEIVDTELTAEQVTPFLQDANVLVNAKLLDQGYDAALLARIELYLAAHFVCLRDSRVQSEQIGGEQARQTFEGKTGLGLDYTRYGQQVKIFDHHGVLVASSTAKRSFEVKVI